MIKNCEVIKIAKELDNGKETHLHIISDDKFIIGDYITHNSIIISATDKLVNAQGLINRRPWKKIIASTDSRLGKIVNDIFIPMLGIENEFVNDYIFGYVDTSINSIKVSYHQTIYGQCNCICHTETFTRHIQACCHPTVIIEPDNKEGKIVMTYKKIKYNKGQIMDICRRFKEDTRSFSTSDIVKELGSTMTMKEIEEEWFKRNI